MRAVSAPYQLTPVNVTTFPALSTMSDPLVESQPEAIGSPSCTATAGAMEGVGGSAATSFAAIVTVAVLSARLSPFASERVTVKLSSASATVSSVIAMATVALVSPAAKVRVPAAPVKSSAPAVPAAVA